MENEEKATRSRAAESRTVAAFYRAGRDLTFEEATAIEMAMLRAAAEVHATSDRAAIDAAAAVLYREVDYSRRRCEALATAMLKAASEASRV